MGGGVVVVVDGEVAGVVVVVRVRVEEEDHRNRNQNLWVRGGVGWGFRFVGKGCQEGMMGGFVDR